MIAVPFIGFILVALLAVGCATFALWRVKTKGRFILIGAIALFLLGVGGGTYWMTGKPALALRDAKGLSPTDINSLIPFLVARVHKEPEDLQAWIYLARAYITLDDGVDSAKAYGRAVAVSKAHHADNPGLDIAYGEALVAANGGAVSDEAMTVFAGVAASQPKDAAARFFLGQGKAERGDTNGAMTLWQGLLAETPASAPLHQALIDRIALLTARGGPGGAPDPRMMVAKLAADLKADPHNAAGWRRLIRAYTVLGQPDEAKTALATARKSFAGDKDTLAQLDADAKDLKIN